MSKTDINFLENRVFIDKSRFGINIRPPRRLIREKEVIDVCLSSSLLLSELNPIANVWSVVKNRVKRSTFNDISNLITRMMKACNFVPPSHLRAFVRHSVNTFKQCKRNEPI